MTNRKRRATDVERQLETAREDGAPNAAAAQGAADPAPETDPAHAAAAGAGTGAPPSELSGQYRKRPVVIEAFRFGIDKPQLWWKEAVDRGAAWVQGGLDKEQYATIRTLEGDHRANHGDWIIRGIKGELYPCKPEIFEATYELADEFDAAIAPDPFPTPLAGDPALVAAACVSDLAMMLARGRIYEQPLESTAKFIAAYLRKHPDAVAESLVIEMRRKGKSDMTWEEMSDERRFAIEVFRLSLLMFDAKLAAMTPAKPWPKPARGHYEAADILADRPGQLTDQAVR